MAMTKGQTVAFGIGAVGKDMAYALSATYVLYYYQDLIGLPAAFVGMILMIARFFDAFNDPLMGIIVAKTRTRWGRFRPWLFSGTVLNAFVMYLLFSCPDLEGAGLMIWFTVIYLLWGVTYTLMDIPYWSMIPATSDTPQERETLSVVGRTCAGVGSAVIYVGTLMAVNFIGNGDERVGFAGFSLVVSIIFLIAEIICVWKVRERRGVAMKTDSVGHMFKALIKNDQAMVIVISILMLYMALYITTNLIIYFFKYDIGGGAWMADYTLFTTVCSIAQILAMMVVYPLLRKKFDNVTIFKIGLITAIVSYLVILGFCLSGNSSNLPMILCCGAAVYLALGVMTVLITVFLSSTVDYGQLKTGTREESVIFSIQTFVVKAGSGIAVFIAGVALDLIGLVGDSSETGAVVQQSASTIFGLEMSMTVIPIIVLIIALIIFAKKWILSDEKVEENARLVNAQLASMAAGGADDPIVDELIDEVEGARDALDAADGASVAAASAPASAARPNPEPKEREK